MLSQVTKLIHASKALRRVLETRSDHAQLVSLTSQRSQQCRVTLLWRDYLTREQGTLLMIDDNDIQEVLGILLAELQAWRAASLKVISKHKTRGSTPPAVVRQEVADLEWLYHAVLDTSSLAAGNQTIIAAATSDVSGAAQRKA
jgi:hypothetical protein